MNLPERENFRDGRAETKFLSQIFALKESDVYVSRVFRVS